MRIHTQFNIPFAELLIALATLTTMTAHAQVAGAAQSKRPPAQALQPALPGADSVERVVASRMQTHDTRMLTPDNSLSFLPPVAYDSGGYTASFVAVGDVNRDGKLDLVLGNECATSGCASGGAGVGSCWAMAMEPSEQQ